MTFFGCQLNKFVYFCSHNIINIPMKKLFLSLFALLLCGNLLYSQNHEILPLDEPTTLSVKEGWVGNTNVSMVTRLEDAEYVIAPRQIEPQINGSVTAVKFYHYPYQEYNTTSYTIKIYEGAQLQWYDQSRRLYEYSSCGQLVYSQDYTASGEGWQTVELDTVYTIPDGEFWVGVQMHGLGTVVFGDESNAVEGQYFFTEMYDYNWYWSPTYFYNSSLYQDVLYSLGLAIRVQGGASIDEVSQSFSIYPNPVADQVHIMAEDLEHITLFDLSGRIVHEYNVSGNETRLDLSDLGTGLYFVKVVTKNGSAVKKVNVVR